MQLKEGLNLMWNTPLIGLSIDYDSSLTITFTSAVAPHLVWLHTLSSCWIFKSQVGESYLQGAAENRLISLSTYLGHPIPGPLLWLLLNRWRRISSPLQSYTHKNITMHHASKKYESSLRFDGDESICLVHFHLLQQRLSSSSLGLDEDESGTPLLTCRTAYYWNLRIFRKGQSLAFDSTDIMIFEDKVS